MVISYLQHKDTYVRNVKALNQFKKKHQEDDVAATLTTLRSQSWQEVVEGLTYV